MDDAYTLTSKKMQQEADYSLDGTTTQMYVYRFYIGRNGPFTFKTPVAGFTGNEFAQHVEQIRTHLRIAAQT